MCLVAMSSSAPDVAKITISSAPSKICPIATAPTAAAIISRSTSSALFRNACAPAHAEPQPPAR
ncbi:Uncharacterised protein [Mycobacterium tuberculosis]|uniref:Uncharacterized protein n=1 Tax=Mycobacterium tuberculosis TaxID=1773 RepID=A0A0U0SEX5_MYCTX|nr:Uncharacterised protein [Mycobacterium tuberculosis]COW75009.1 Uncharacterised protein [Mycobacterium tuberculosis]COX15590.1 Uncharacterised protein [Mycobacterium tuberculosis]